MTNVNFNAGLDLCDVHAILHSLEWNELNASITLPKLLIAVK